MNCWLGKNSKENWILRRCREGILQYSLKVRYGAGLIATGLYSPAGLEKKPNKNTSKYTWPMYVTDISRGCLQFLFFMVITQNIGMGTGHATTNSQSVGIQVSTFVYLAFQIALGPRHDRGPSLCTS